jgi:hypothetical protein
MNIKKVKDNIKLYTVRYTFYISTYPHIAICLDYLHYNLVSYSRARICKPFKENIVCDQSRQL